MVGESLTALEDTLQTIFESVRRDPQFIEWAYVSVITFAAKARVVCPLTELFYYRPPKLSAKPGSALGAALTLLLECLDREVVKSTPGKKGDFTPMVLLFTDGQPTDEWVGPAKILTDQRPKVKIFTIRFGDDTEFGNLGKLTEISYHVNEFDFKTNILDIYSRWSDRPIEDDADEEEDYYGYPYIYLPDHLIEDKPINLLIPNSGDHLISVDLTKPPVFTLNNRFFLHGLCSEHKKKYPLPLSFKQIC
jgi:uncharacterized protein YegL